MDKFPLTHYNKSNRSELFLTYANCFARLSYDAPTTEKDIFLYGVLVIFLMLG